MQGPWSWLKKHTVRRRSVAGLVMLADGAQWVILAGDTQLPDAVCAAERLPIPQGWVTHGVVHNPSALAQWLKQHLSHGCLIVCVGALIDFMAGRTRRAPPAWRRAKPRSSALPFAGKQAMPGICRCAVPKVSRSSPMRRLMIVRGRPISAGSRTSSPSVAIRA